MSIEYRVAMGILSVFSISFGLFCLIRPNTIAKWWLSWMTDNEDAEPSDLMLIRPFLTGIFLLVCGGILLLISIYGESFLQ